MKGMTEGEIQAAVDAGVALASDVSPEQEGKSTFLVDGRLVAADACIEGVLVNPVLPANFNDTPNDARPEWQAWWWDRPYVVGCTSTGPQWKAAWPSGTRYDVRCLDGGAWDRSTVWGAFGTVAEAVTRIRGR